MAGLAAARMSGGSEFHAAGPACEKVHSPNLVRSRGVTYLLLKADRRPVSPMCCCTARNTDDVFEICLTSDGVYSVHDHSQLKV